MAYGANYFPFGKRGHRGIKRAAVSFLRSTGPAASGHTSRMVGNQEVQLHGLPPNSAGPAVCADGCSFLYDSGRQGSAATKTDERRSTSRSKLAAEISPRSIAQWRKDFGWKRGKCRERSACRER